jgi:hypothetical protein
VKRLFARYWFWGVIAGLSQVMTGCEVLPPNPTESATGIFYVSTAGNDANPGTKRKPFATLRRACEVAGPGHTVFLRAGNYPETLLPRQSGLPGAPITFSRYADERVVLVSGRRITGWKPYRDGIHVADCPVDLGSGLNQVICNGELMIEARTPNIEDQYGMVSTFRLHKAMTTLTGPDTVRTMENNATLQSGEPVHYIGRHGGAWGTQVAIGTFDDAGNMSIQKRTNKDYMSWWKAKGEGYVVGAAEYLDHPREWCLDRKAGKLYFYPPPGKDPNTADVYVKDREMAIDLHDRQHIVVDGITTLMGGVRLENAGFCTIRNGTLLYGGHHSFFESPYTYDGCLTSKSGVSMTGSNNLIERCRIAWNAGASIVVGGVDNRVLNSRIHDSGLLGSYYSGIYIFQEEKLHGGGHEIGSNTLYNLGRGAIHMASIGGWGDPGTYAKPISIHHNHISGAMSVCDDGGAIYQFCTDGAGSQIHHNWIFGSNGEKIYFDNHSFGWFVHHNVMDGELNMNFPVGRIHLYNNTLLTTRYFIPKYFWDKTLFVANNIDTCWLPWPVKDDESLFGLRPTQVRFHAAGGGGLNFRVNDVPVEVLPKGQPRKAGVKAEDIPAYRPDYFGAYAYGDPSPWVPGCDWGGPVPEIPHAFNAAFPVPASSLASGDGVINNALYIITTGTTASARYADVDFGAGYSHVVFEVMMEQEMSNAVLELRLGSRDGDVVARASIAYRPSENHQFFVDAAKLKPVTGQHDVYLVVYAGKRMNIATFTLMGVGKTPLYEVSPRELVEEGPQKIEATAYGEGRRVLLMKDHDFKSPGGYLSGNYELMGCEAGTWVFFPGVDFGVGLDHVMVNVGHSKHDAVPPRVELRSDSPDGALLGALDIKETGEGKWQEQRMELKNASGVHDLFLVFPRPFHGGLNYIVF